MLKPFSYEQPTTILFGEGGLADLPRHVAGLGGSRVLVVSDPGVAEAGLLARATEVLEDRGIAHTAFTDIASDPSVDSADAAAEAGRAAGCDLVVGLGGGSAIDAAKAAALLLHHTDCAARDLAGIDQVPGPGMPLVAIPTTAGTGSEVTKFSVLSDKRDGKKLVIGSAHCYPTLALCDPALTLGLPAHLTAATGMDALTHALESFTNKATFAITEALAAEAMALIARSLRTAVAQPDNRAARYDMLLASTMAGMAFNSTRVGIVHALALPLGARFGIHHGLANALVLPAVMRFNLVGDLAKFARIAEIFGEPTTGLSLRSAAGRAVTAIEQLAADIGVDRGLAAFGVGEEHLGDLAEAALDSGNVPVNPRTPTREDLQAICRAAL